MQLRLTVVPPAPAADGDPLDLVVDTAPGTPLLTVAGQLLNGTQGPLFAGDQLLDDDAVLGRPPLLDGAVLTVGAPGAPLHPPAGLLELRVCGGPDAGQTILLGPGETRVGRSEDADLCLSDPDLSRLHAVLTVAATGVTVADLGSSNGTSIDGTEIGTQPVPLLPGALLRLGESSLVLAAPDASTLALHPDGRGRLELNRPPRWRPPGQALRLTVPAEPQRRKGMRVPLLAALLPVPLGIGMVALTHNLSFALFLLLSPVLMLGNAVSDRISGRRDYRRQHAGYVREAAHHQAHLAHALAQECRQRRAAAPDPAALLLTATGPRPGLWERRPDDDDHLLLRLGLADQPSSITLAHSETDPAGTAAGHPVAPAVPVLLPLREVGVLGIAGPRPRTHALARFVLGQLAGLHSPYDLDLVLLGADETLSWARLLPHVAPRHGEDCQARLGAGDEQVGRRVGELVAQVDARRAALQAGHLAAGWHGPCTVVLVAGSRALRTVPGLAHVLADGPEVGIYAVCLADEPADLPAECGATAVVTGAVGTRLDVHRTGHDAVLGAVADLVTVDWAVRLARALAPVVDSTPRDVDGVLPDSVRLAELIGADPPSAEQIAACWHQGARSTAALLGVAADGPCVVDLVRDGPHTLVAGTTGAGKSELLQTMIASLALANRPDELTFLLVDYKGGSAFKDCVDLPHTVGLVTDLDAHLTERALASLDAELKRRERLLAGAGCKDIEAYQLARAADPRSAAVPRLVLVIDEFAALVTELPGFVDGLVDIGRRGRSLGVHLVLATQRPAGVVSADIRANTNRRLCLRVTDAAESMDVLDGKEAALISRHHPGRAFCRSGAGPLEQFQTARVGGRRPPPTGPTATVTRSCWQALGDPVPASPDPAAEHGPSDLALLVGSLQVAARLAGVPQVPSPWLPPLPPVLSLADIAPGAGAGLSVPLGIQDLPAQQTRAGYLLDLEHGSHLLAAGGPRSGRTTLLRTVAGSLACRCSVADAHIYAIDCASGGLQPLTRLPQVGAVVGRDETARGDRLLSRLQAEVTRRQDLLGRTGFGSVTEQRACVAPADRLPYLVLLLDGFEGFTAAYESVDHGRPLEALLRLLRDGPAAGLRAVVTGDRSTLTGRISSVLPARLLLQMADPADYAYGGLTLRQVPQSLPRGRGLIAGDPVTEVQVALLSADPSGPAQVAELTRLADDAAGKAAFVDPALRPFRLDPLPDRIGYREVAARIGATAPGWSLLGVGGDELAPIGIDLAEEGPAFVVAGPPRSGRSTALLTLAAWCRTHGTRVAVVTGRRSPLRELKGQDGVVGLFGPTDARELADALRLEDGPVAVLVDDAEALLDAPVEQTLLEVLAAGLERPWTTVVAGTIEDMAGSYRGLAAAARKHKTGLLLSPTGPLDGDLLGVRLTRGLSPQPGRGVLAVKGRAQPIQVAG